MARLCQNSRTRPVRSLPSGRKRRIKLGKELEGLDYPPIPGELGKKIWLHVSKEAWKNWQQLQTMMVNEYQLNLSDPNVRKHLLNQCDKYFFGEGISPESVPNYVPPEQSK